MLILNLNDNVINDFKLCTLLCTLIGSCVAARVGANQSVHFKRNKCLFLGCGTNSVSTY